MSSSELVFRQLETVITSRSPEILLVLLHKTGKRFGKLREFVNEAAIIAHEPKETSELFDILWR